MRRPTRRGLARAVLAAGVAAATVLVGGSAEAAEPAQQACVGESLAALATTQLVPGDFGHAVTGFAQDPLSPPGLGDGIQAFQAGAVDDEVVPNTCND